MKKTAIMLALIASILFAVFFPSDFFVSSTYHARIASEFQLIPIPSANGTCSFSAYKSETYFFGGPPFTMEPYMGNTAYEFCFFTAKASKLEALNAVRTNMTREGWTYTSSNDAESDRAAKNNCVYDTFTKEGYTLGTSDCPYKSVLYSPAQNEQQLQKIEQDTSSVDTELALSYQLSAEESVRLQLISGLLFGFKILLLLAAIICNIVLRRRKII